MQGIEREPGKKEKIEPRPCATARSPLGRHGSQGRIPASTPRKMNPFKARDHSATSILHLLTKIAGFAKGQAGNGI